MERSESADVAVQYLEQALKACQSHVTLTNVQLQLLQRSWANCSYREIAEELAYEYDYVKQLGAQVWQLLSQATGQKVTKSNVQAVLTRLGHQSNWTEPPPALQCDWGEATDVSVFFGREQELETLCQWVEGVGQAGEAWEEQPCRLMTLLGMGGIGKTALAVRLAEQLTGISRWGKLPVEPVVSTFRALCWKSLRDAPTLSELLTTLLKSLAPQSPIPETTGGQLSQLLQVLQTQRCLIVLDNFDALLEAGTTGSYRQDRQDYGELLRRLGEVPHQSCVVITSREKPEELLALAGDAVRVVQLQGLTEASGERLVQAKGLTGRPEALHSLVKHYGGNPLALKIAASSIQDRYQGDLNRFLRQKDSLFKSISTLLQQQIERLSPLEIQVMNWLAINRESVSLEELQADLPAVESVALAEALESLVWRCLIERTSEGFTQQPVVMEQVTQRLIEQLLEELLLLKSAQTVKAGSTGTDSLLERYALVKATAKDYIRESQTRMIVEPLLTQLGQRLAQGSGSARRQAQLLDREALARYVQQYFAQRWDQQLHQAQNQAQPQNQNQPGYGTGNILNLLRYLQFDFTDLDLSHRRIWQAYLADVNLHYASFQAAELRQCVFAETFGGIVSVAISPGGERLASADSNGDIRVWDLERNQPILALRAHRSWIWSIAFSPDGKWLATASDDNSVKIWQVESGLCLYSLEEHKRAVLAALFSPDGQRLATSSDDLTIRLWRVDAEGHLSPEQTWQDTHERRVWALSFSPDGQTLASSSEDRTVKFWQVATGTCLQTLVGHTDWVRAIAFHPNLPPERSPEHSLFASGSHDQTIHLWQRDPTSEQPDAYVCRQTLRGHTGPVTAVAFSPTSRHLISASHDQTLRLWDLDTGQCISLLQGHSNRLWAALFSPSGRWIASGGDDNAVKLWDWQRGSCIKTFQGHTNATLPIALSGPTQSGQPPEKQVLASGHEDEVVRVWDRQSGQVIQTLRGHSDRVWYVAFGPRHAGKHLLASGSGDQTIRLWNWRTGTCQKILTGHTSWVWSLQFHPSRPILASASYDTTVKLWDVTRGSCLQTCQGHEASVVGVLFSPDGSWLASCGYDHTIRFWDLEGTCLRILRGHQNTVWQLALSPDGRQLASCSYDQTVKLWDLETGDCLQTYEGHVAPIVTLAFSSDGQELFSAGFDATIRRWQVATGSCNQVIPGHQGVISKLLVDDQLISSSFDETIKFWDLASGTCVQTWRTPRPYEGLDITAATGLTEAQRTTLIALGAVESAGLPAVPPSQPSLRTAQRPA